MKLSLECSVRGRVKIGRQLKVVNGLIEYLLIPDDKGWLSSIKIIKKVATPQKYSARWGPGEGKVNATLTIEGDREEYLELVREFQELESLLSFDTGGSLKSIAWDEPKENFIPETEEEKRQVGVYSFHFTKEYPDYPAHLGERVFAEVIATKEYFASLVVPLAFYREGINEYHSRRYINAFYNFYFVLEDMYGKGKTRNKAIGDAFRKSEAFRGFMIWTIEESLVKYEKHRINIQKFCEEEEVPYDTDGLIDLLLKVRGNLHHYSGRSSKHVGTPFVREEFASVAFITLGLAVRAILQRMVEINLARGVGKK